MIFGLVRQDLPKLRWLQHEPNHYIPILGFLDLCGLEAHLFLKN
jgi:hypothetical protein